MAKKNKRDKGSEIKNAAVAGAAYEDIQKIGAAAKEHYVAYSGQDNEVGRKLVKGLKQVSEEKVNPDFEFQNIHQQAGFSAEIKDVARSNAESIIKGSPERKIRTDDLGRVNDQLHDTVILDRNGDIVEGTGAQMKFLGSSMNDPERTGDALRILDKLDKKKGFEKYLDADAKIDVQSDQYDSILEEADKRIARLSRQLNKQREMGNTDEVEKLQNHIDKLNKIKKNLRKSTLSEDEALFARLHPGLSTAVDVVKLSHKAGMQIAGTAAVIGGSVSIVKNLVSLYKDEITPEEAIKNVISETGCTAATGYGTGFVGSALKGAMQNSKSEYVRTLSKTNLAGTVVAVAVSATKTLTRYFNGEIDGVECLETLGEQGTGMVSSAMFSVIGQFAIPIPVVGGMIGGMIGYALSSATYGILVDSLNDAKIAKQDREIIEAACNEHIKMIREYRKELETSINKYLADSMEEFRESFSEIKSALAIGDVDWFVEEANAIRETFGGEPLCSNAEDFCRKMDAKVKFVL